MVNRIVHTFEGTANAICANRETTLVCVAGRGVFKIFKVLEDSFEESINLKTPAAGLERRLGLNFSASDVAWSPVEDNVLASAATNGTVVIWDLNRAQKTKHDFHYKEHNRTVHRVEIHPLEGSLVLSGSQDGYMKLFDARQKKVTHVFSSSDCVRDVQFNSNQSLKFAAALESGNVQVWDRRVPDKPELHLQCHRGPVFSVNWHPEEKHRLATAGRDKFIKVWDVVGHPRPHSPFDSIQTIGPVARIKWRPHHKYHIASCCLLVDCNINVWDIRRPYIPFAQFGEHTDVATGLMWRSDPQMLLSCGKDSQLVQHVFKDANHPANHANPVGLAINNRGYIALARSDKRVESLSSSYCASLQSTSPDATLLPETTMSGSAAKNVTSPVTSTVFPRSSLMSTAKRPSISPSVTNPAYNAHAPIQSASGSAAGSPIHGPPAGLMSNATSAVSSHNFPMVAAGLVSSTVSAFIPSHMNTSAKFRPNIFNTFGVPKSSANWSELFVKDKKSSLVVFNYLHNLKSSSVDNFSMDFFIETARRYRLTGASFNDLCDHNASVADELGRFQIAQSWRITKLFFWKPAGIKTCDGTSSSNAPPGSTSSLTGAGGSAAGSTSLSRTTSNVSNLPVLDIPKALAAANETHPVSSTTPQTLGAEPSVFVGAASAASSSTDARLQPETENSCVGGSDDESEPGDVSDQERNLTSIASGQGLLSLNKDLFYDPVDLGESLSKLRQQQQHQHRRNGRSRTMEPVVIEDFLAGAYHLTRREETKPDWVLPSEAFDQRQNILEKSPSSSPVVDSLIEGAIADDVAAVSVENPPKFFGNGEMEISEGKTRESRKDVIEPNDAARSTSAKSEEVGAPLKKSEVNEVAGKKQETVVHLISPNSDAIFKPNYWDFSEILKEMLHFYADHGDIQMTVSCLLVLDDKAKDVVDSSMAEIWITGYVDLLRRFQLWVEATEILKLSLPYVMISPETNTLSQQSTLIRTSCYRCNRYLSERGWACNACNKATNTCAFCHQAVKGLYVWCQGCSHGGHLDHMRLWFKSSKYCPTGCGHICNEIAL